ncbi:MAG: efflux transporter outer membrane subunit [Firmicutes bacterium]|nr:efflux transporter outer membrane subunit [Bacillota bacterium]MCM1401140.1 efflux transporter outer membrane subunit [Bacteroides sp.]MCM1477037.1 efflux transporter outer membrane subunit [Bacteroides sp.]
MKYIHIPVIATMVLLISACNGTRQCASPQLNLPDSFTGTNNRPIASDSLSMADMAWWNFYGDSILCGLIRIGLENNKDVLIAAARIEEAKALYGAASSELLPTVSGTIYANRETNDYSGKHTDADPELGVKLSLSWEADLWKRLSWGKKKAHAQYQASVEDMRAMQMSVMAEIAEAYFRLMALDSELDIVKRTLMTRSEGLEQAKLRFEGGLTSEMVYRQAEVEYTSTASLVPALEEKIQLTENALRLLVGEYAGPRLVRPKTILSEVVMKSPRIGVPSTMVRRRPDLRASEYRLMEAMADVGIAWADRFPRFTIGLTGGIENNKLADIIKSPFSFVVGSLTSPVFDFGKRKKKHQAAVANYDQARLEYEKNVLTAFKEVSDALTSYRSAQRTAGLKTELRDAAMKYVELSRVQYTGGTSLYIDVLDAQRRYFEAQIALSYAVRDEYLALVNLYKSLGGGWSYSAQAEGTDVASIRTEL